MCDYSNNQSDPTALPFGSHQDALDFASHGAEHLNRVLASDNLINLVERYAKGEMEIWVPLNGPIGEAGINYLVFIAVPRIENQNTTSTDYKISAQAKPNTPNTNGINHFMLRGVTKLVQSPKGVIPSFVRFECSKKV